MFRLSWTLHSNQSEIVQGRRQLACTHALIYNAEWRRLTLHRQPASHLLGHTSAPFVLRRYSVGPRMLPWQTPVGNRTGLEVYMRAENSTTSKLEVHATSNPLARHSDNAEDYSIQPCARGQGVIRCQILQPR